MLTFKRLIALAGLTSWSTFSITVFAASEDVLQSPLLDKRLASDDLPDLSFNKEERSFVPSGGATAAGGYAANLCHWLGDSFKANSKLSISTSFSQYYPEGANPSLELLSATYPPGLIPPKLKVAGVLASVGPDVDIQADYGYGRSIGRQRQNGPLGGLPAFCRFGASVVTSKETEALVEVWLPLASDAAIPLAKINGSDYPTNSTPFMFSRDAKTIIKQPLWAPAARQEEEEQEEQSANKAHTADGAVSPAAPVDSSNGAQRLDSPSFKRAVHNRLDQQRRTHQDYLTGDQVLGQSPGWNGRMLFIANGAQRGWIPLTDMKQAISRFRFATVSTNLGHFSNASATDWVVGPQHEDTILDWASRATHVSRLAGEEVINLFYGTNAGVRVDGQIRSDENGISNDEDDKEDATDTKLSGRASTEAANIAHSPRRIRAYMAGCSTGGKAGLSSAMYHPDDFDGILAGSPAIFFNRLNRGQIKEQSVWRKEIAKDGMFNITLLPGAIHKEILKQCDALDGLADGVINDPRKCKPDLSPLLCPNSQPSDNLTCITQPQIDNIGKLYTPTVLNDTFVYDQYFPGLEAEVGTLTGTAGKAIGWYELAILKFPKVRNNTLWNGYKNITLEIVEKGEKLNPGGSNTDIRDLSPFINAKKKLIHYHGLADITVSPAASMRFYDEVEKAVQGKLAHGGSIADSYKFFPVPGMGHCRDGDAAWHFGGITQNDPGNRPYRFDTQHDILLSLVAWVEHGIAPYEPVAAKYGSITVDLPTNPNTNTSTSVDNGIPTKIQSYDYGLEYTRKLCPYPTFPKYSSGSTTGQYAYKSFHCV